MTFARTFAELRKAEWNEEDHPRDEDGKFSNSGSGQAAQGKAKRGGDDPVRTQVKIRAYLLQNGFPGSRVIVKSLTPPPRGGVYNASLGEFNPTSGKIYLNKDFMGSATLMKGIARHELAHAKFNKALPEVRQLIRQSAVALERDDGTTSYAREFWGRLNMWRKTPGTSAKDLRALFEIAVNESFAEMSKLGKFKGIYSRLAYRVENKWRRRTGG